MNDLSSRISIFKRTIAQYLKSCCESDSVYYVIKIFMKKIILGALMLCSITTFAQDIKFGVKAGINIANLAGDYPATSGEYLTVETGPITSFHLGGFVEFQLKEKIKFAPELLLSRQGNDIETKGSPWNPPTQTFQTISFRQSPSLLYLNIPIMFKYEVIKKLHLEVGPQIGFLLSAKSKWEYTNADAPAENSSVTVDLLNDGVYYFGGQQIYVQRGMNGTDLSFNVGASYDITKNLFVQFRYTAGLVAVDSKSQLQEEVKSLDLKNNVLQFSAAYRF